VYSGAKILINLFFTLLSVSLISLKIIIFVPEFPVSSRVVVIRQKIQVLLHPVCLETGTRYGDEAHGRPETRMIFNDLRFASGEA